MKYWIQFIVYLLVSAALVEADAIVNTTHGLVQGSVISGDGIEYYAYQGIKYGQAERFKSPQPIDPWNGTYDATSYKVSCLQLAKTPGINDSEDCLYLNFYVPKNLNLTDYPVMVYLHGGGFIGGDSSINRFGPDNLVKQGVAVATLNYRLGIFGFLSTEDSAATGNWGIKDIILALKWVKDNARNFGGNPNNITIFGESAGGALVGYIVQSPKAAGLFHRAISMSGNNLCPWSLTSNPMNVAVKTGVLVGCPALSTQDLVNCLRDVDADVLRNAAQIVVGLKVAIFMYGLVNDQGFGPCIEPVHDDAVISSSNYQAFLSGNFNRVPWMIGFNSEEALAIEQEGVTLARTLLLQAVALPSILVSQDMDASALGAVAAGKAVANYYFNGHLLIPFASDAQIIKYFSDNLFDRSTRELIRITAPYIPVWYYRFSYYDSLGPFTYQLPGAGKAQHGSIVYYIWKINLPELNNTDFSQYSPEDFKIRDAVITVITNFAKYGNPTPISDPVLQNVQWPLAYSSGNQTVQCYDINNNITVVSNPEQSEYSMWRNLYNDFGDHNYITY